VRIEEGQVFLLPSRVPHSPQREEGSFGLVIERERSLQEKDGLLYYTNFLECKDVLWERYFHCSDLAKDLVPVVKAFKESEECSTRVPKDNIEKDPPLKIDTTVVVPDPFNLQAWIDAREDELKGTSINLFEGHPDKEFEVLVVGGPIVLSREWELETCFLLTVGSCTVNHAGIQTVVPAGSCFVVVGPFNANWEDGSRGLQIKQDPCGNRAN